ncbi:RDD family protein [Rhizobium sp. P38BS-XIX]|uniref:RDD family protein n=1 Tax=Rhizobium sp. P38BS-XIX TaxID=2726740 RepID=UPI00145771E8|nr:RDD family protein [Rhizobium sp. P38BS-XIX]NLR95600.1 RDD family protein [Rhizobium sp. P38BS-XIX]
MAKWNYSVGDGYQGPVEKNEISARPWPRFLARYIDTSIMLWLLLSMLSLVSSLYAPALYIKIMNTGNSVWTFCLLPIVALVLALVMALTGRTIGKAILGIRVPIQNGQGRLGFFLLRELKVWLVGLGLGIPVFSLVTQIYQCRRVAAGKPASYDQGGIVVLGSSSKLRVWGGLLVALSVTAFLMYLQAQYVLANYNIYATQPWINPVSNRTARMARMWQAEELQANSGRMFYFAANAQLAAALFGYEQLGVDGIDNLTYAKAFGNAITSDVTMTSDWTRVIVYGYPSLRATGKSLRDDDVSVEMTVLVIGRHAWKALVFARGRPIADLPGRSEFVEAAFTTVN